MQIKLIMGLGNPGKEYENTRHNIGFLFVDELAKTLDAPDFEFDKKLNSEISTAKHKLILAKPQTLMNNSGGAVAFLGKLYKIKPENILIVHDDIDILWGNYKLSFGRSSAGHKGVKSIIKALKTKNFWRLRIGIQLKNEKRKAKKIRAEKIILKKFIPKEIKTLNKTMEKSIVEIEKRTF